MTSGLVTHLMWALGLDESLANKATSILAQWEDPTEGALQFSRCESPIERMFLLGFVLGDAPGMDFSTEQEDWDAHCEGAPEGSCSPRPEDLGHSWKVGNCGERGFALFQQFKIDGYRVDFLIRDVCQDLHRVPFQHLAIEIDGHDFHERTKEQAARDRRRDRALMANKILVIRFTGSEVFADPHGCASEAVAQADALANARDAAVTEAYEYYSQAAEAQLRQARASWESEAKKRKTAKGAVQWIEPPIMEVLIDCDDGGPGTPEEALQ